MTKFISDSVYIEDRILYVIASPFYRTTSLRWSYSPGPDPKYLRTTFKARDLYGKVLYCSPAGDYFLDIEEAYAKVRDSGYDKNTTIGYIAPSVYVKGVMCRDEHLTHIYNQLSRLHPMISANLVDPDFTSIGHSNGFILKFEDLAKPLRFMQNSQECINRLIRNINITLEDR